MAKKTTMFICGQCGRKATNECQDECEAVRVLREIYTEHRTQEKRQLIRSLKRQIDIADAQPSKEMRLLAQRIIAQVEELHFIRHMGIKVGYVSSYEKKTKSGRMVFGDCRKVNPTYSAYLPYDFIITFYEPNISHLTENQIKVLMWHELKHIDIGVRGFTVKPHDIEDFQNIIEAHGMNWGELGADIADILE